MSRSFKFFLTSFFLSLPFWWGMNIFEKNLNDFFFWYEISQNPQIFTAQISLEERLAEMKPIRNREIPDLEIEAKSAISFLIKSDGEKILFEKEKDKVLPIASLTKLMTAYVVLENYDLSKEIKMTKKAILQEGDFGKLEMGKIYSVEYLLYPLLMESSNDAAYALTNDYNDEEGMSREKFLELMNLTAQKLNLENTYFFNPTGLEPEEDKLTTQLNYSTVNDLVKLTKELLKKPSIWKVLSTSTYNLYGPELKNTNELLGKIPGIIGGKTGYTEKAGGCILLVSMAPNNKGYLINVILGANGGSYRFNEMEKLIDWVNSAYKW